MSQTKPKYMSVIEAYCDASETFNFQDDSEKRVGHITQLVFPSLNKALIPDLSLYNPTSTDKREMVSAAIDSLRWEGASGDPVEIRGYISAQNKALLQEILISVTESIEIELGLIIYEYDFDEKKYFKRFYINKGSVQLVLSEIQVADDSSYHIKKPRVFEFRMTLVSKENAPAQEVGFAFCAKGTQFTRQIGG